MSDHFDCQLPREARTQLLLRQRQARMPAQPLKPAKARRAPALMGLGGLLLFLALITIIGFVSNSTAPVVAVHPTSSLATPESWAPRAILVHHMTEAEYQRRKATHELTLADVNRHDRGE
jgi:hypothetical protein